MRDTEATRKTSRSAAVRQAVLYLALVAEPTATGVAIVLPGGETIFISADDAWKMLGNHTAMMQA